MRNTVIRMLVAAGLVLSSAAVVHGDGQQPASGAAARPGAFNPRDFSGIWGRDSRFYTTPCRDCGDRGYSHEWPVFTPEGQRRFEANKPARGRALGSPQAEANVKEHIGRRRAVLPAFSNDPQMTCNPLGLVRNILYNPGLMEFLQTPERTIQFFEWTWDFREVWTDGRKAPDPAEYLPRWNGFSVGRWEGDTFVVETTGFDDRQWLDHHGYPISEQMRLTERWRRTAADTLEVSMTVTDPLIYAKPWVSETKKWKLVPREKLAIDGWAALAEDKCVPLDEVETFNKVRDGAAGVGR